MGYEYITQKVELEIRDTQSGHLWRYEINNLRPLVHIYKNGDFKKTSTFVETPISEKYLEELREGL